MNKIPVLGTIRAAYGFTFQHLGSIIAAIWLPMVIVTVAGFFTIQSFFGGMIDTLSGSNPGALGPSFLMMFAYLAASVLLYAVMYAAVIRLALGEPSAGPAHFSLGPVEWRVFRSLFALAGIFFLLVIGAMLAVFVGIAAASVSGLRFTPLQTTALLSGIVYLVVGLAVPRFFLLLPAIAVAEDGPVLRRAWDLSAGNFLRFLGVMIAVFAPSLLIMQLADALLPGSGAAAQAGGEQAQQTIAALQRERTVMPLVSGIAFFVSPLTLGLVAGASVAAWRALTDKLAGAARVIEEL